MLRRLVFTAVASAAALVAVVPVAPGASAAPVPAAAPVAVPAALSASVPSALVSVPAHVPAALPLSVPLPPPMPLSQQADKLTITVLDADASGATQTYKLTCAPVGGSHPRAQAACDRLAQLAGEFGVGAGKSAGARDPFAPVPVETMCTLQYGGPATARITGVWQGRGVSADFSRKNGCEISRWRNLEPVLPTLTS
ncbi:SSI family serine proteinase inhibitor [Streptomyces sp. NPDC088725]|uniref:SSI family serine proteinase inhibitor n=1 Tax=Streptomyces sp. NPDC088725 TaxID=3365873 RepID=UPI003818A9E5